MTERKPRKDAERNRAAVLAAADDLFARGANPESVTMADIAVAAGVGKATLFRAFGDRTGLIQTLYQARLDPIKEAVEEGPPPLGPAPRRCGAYRPCSTPSSVSSSTTAISPWRWRKPAATALTGRSTTGGGTARSRPYWSRSPVSPTAASPPTRCSPPPVPTSSNTSSASTRRASR